MAMFVSSICVSILASTVLLVYQIVRRAVSLRQLHNHDKSAASWPIDKPLSQPSSIPADSELMEFKDLYYKLHHLEQFPEILPRCRELLQSFLGQTISEAQPGSILSIRHYSQHDLNEFLSSSHFSTTDEYEKYIARRRAGNPREMFPTAEDAKRWLKQAAPVKYVDGAWLGHINKISTPVNLRPITKNAWQVMSEELGDGDLRKNHYHVYRQLMQHISANLPDADQIDFIHTRHNLNDKRVWKAALAQLLISLFPHDFLPEILGFNMAYECLPLHLLKTVKELDELRIPSYYFVLHVSIDNNDSGHAAMAMQCVIDYLDHCQAEGEDAVQMAWRKIQAGFMLAEGLPTTPETRCPGPSVPLNGSEAAMAQVFQRKCGAYKIHCNSRIKFGNKTLVEWLDPQKFRETSWQRAFLDSLAGREPWVVKGNAKKSKLVQEMCWGGRMFGAFTESEISIVEAWISSLNNRNSEYRRIYLEFTELATNSKGASPSLQASYPDFRVPQVLPTQPDTTTISSQPLQIPHFDLADINIRQILPLWFTAGCLLECFPNLPVHVSNKAGCAIVRILRAQYGFLQDGDGVAGMAELARTQNGDAIGLVEVGIEMSVNAGLQVPRGLPEVLSNASERAYNFTTYMRSIAMRPLEYRYVLIGLTLAFVGLHKAVEETFPALSEHSRMALRQIAIQEEENLMVCIAEARHDEKSLMSLTYGLSMGVREISAAVISPAILDI